MGLIKVGMPVFDEKTYAEAKPHFVKAWHHSKGSGHSLKEFIQLIAEEFGAVIKPYLKRFLLDIKAGRIDLDSTNGEYDSMDNSEQDTRSLLGQLLTDSQLFKKSDEYKKLLDCIICMPNFAPFNAMLLQVQKPGLSYAASSWDWQKRFGRTIKQDARPLIILWPFGPVALVYDVLDTEGKDLPEHIYAFPAKGAMTQEKIFHFISRIAKKGLNVEFIDKGDNQAGRIIAVKRAKDAKEQPHYVIKVNQNHNPNVQFATLAHELGHLFLGHLGLDKALSIPDRASTRSKNAELEAESIAYLICSRHGVENKSESYLSKYVKENQTVDQLDIYQIMRAAGQVETVFGLGEHTKFEPKKRKSK